jgi:methylamine dehydrogenase accessory protein MauD
MDAFGASYVVLWTLVIAEGVAIFVLLRAVGSIFLGGREAIERDGLPLGAVAPPFEAHDAAGRPVQLAHLLGRWSVLIFASPSCGICRELLPTVQSLSRDLGGAADISVLLRGEVEDARLMQESLAGPIRILAIGRNGIAQRYRVRVSPYAQVLDASGRVRAKGLVNTRDHVEHLLSSAGLEHRALDRHLEEITAEASA